MSNKVFTPDFANMCVVEKAEKVKPVIDDYYLSGDYATDLDVYEQHIASLRTIQAPWLDKSKHDRELVEGVDFRIVYRISQSSGWVATHFTMYDKFPDDKRRITTVPLSPAEPPAEKVWPLLGYAPGHYSNHCANCGKEMSNVDKLCFQCLECAVKCANRIMASVPPAEEGKGEGNSAGYSMNFPIGSEHWFNTSMWHVKSIGEYMKSHDELSKDLLGVWGKLLYDIANDMFSWRQSKPASAPVYPAGFVEWCSDNYDHRMMGWFGYDDLDTESDFPFNVNNGAKPLTTHELYTGPYQTYLQTKKL